MTGAPQRLAFREFDSKSSPPMKLWDETEKLDDAKEINRRSFFGFMASPSTPPPRLSIRICTGVEHLPVAAVTINYM